MNKKLFNYILSSIKSGKQLKFEMSHHNGPPLLDCYNIEFSSQDLKLMFENWVNNKFSNVLFVK